MKFFLKTILLLISFIGFVILLILTNPLPQKNSTLFIEEELKGFDFTLALKKKVYRELDLKFKEKNFHDRDKHFKETNSK
jgi:hypothetical protein